MKSLWCFHCSGVSTVEFEQVNTGWDSGKYVTGNFH